MVRALCYSLVVTALEALTTHAPVKLTVEDFLVLDRAGAFASYNKTELINGMILVVNAQYSEHLKAKVRLLRRLADACDAMGHGFEAWSEGSVEMGQASMPEPDIFITRETPGSGAVRRETIALIVEVSDTTQAFDLGEKARLYAENGVPEYWVVDLKAKAVRQMWSPGAKGYGERRDVALGERVEAVTIAGLRVETVGL